MPIGSLNKMRFYIAYRFKGSNKKELKELLESLCFCLGGIGHQTFVFLTRYSEMGASSDTYR